MPTADRRVFAARAIRYFLRQDYPRKELIVVDDGCDPIDDILPIDTRVRYLRLSQRTSVGEKRNVACAHANGSLIAHWDDDDWQAAHRLRVQAEAIQRQKADVCGLTTLLFYDTARTCAWQYTYPADRGPWLGGSTLV